jgi:hypothetical protein
MRRDNRGISRIVEFVIMFTVFIVIVTAFYSLANIWLRPPIVDYAQEEAMRISEVLIGNPGYMDNGETNWEDYPAYYKDAPNIDTNMTSLGFAKDKQSYGVLSMSKILGMGKITYFKARTLLGLSTGKNFNISFQIIGDETKTCLGADYTNAKNVGMYKRIVAVYNPIDNNYTSAKLTIRLFDGGFYNESIKINEIMYNPPGDDTKNEWVELYNPTNMAINVTGWRLGRHGDPNWMVLKGVDDPSYSSDILFRGAIVPSNGFAVVPRNISDVYKNFTCNPDVIWLTKETGTPPNELNNINDTVILKNRYYDTMDSVPYNASWGGNGNNETLERISPWENNLGESQTGEKGGTLGRRNTRSDFSNPNLGNLISVGPDRCKKNEIGIPYILYNITVMNNGNVNHTITISNISKLGWNVSIVWLSGGTANWTNPDGTIGVNLSAINSTTNISHIYAKFRVNVTIPAGTPSGTQNIAIVIAKSSEYSMVFDTASILAKVS